MSQISTEELQRLLQERLAKEPVRRVLVTRPDSDLDDSVVRVMLFVDDTEKLDQAEADRLRKQVRAVLAAIDDRVPSIRFSEAA